MNPWWSGLHPAQTTLACGEHTHRLRWETGALHMLDHGDAESELALAALGGERCACVSMLEAWARHDSDMRVLVLASRGPADPLAAREDWTAQLGSVTASAVPSIGSPARASTRSLLRLPSRRRAMAARSSAVNVGTAVGTQPPGARGLSLRTQGESELVALLGLGGGLQDRLVATVAAAWAQRFEQPDAALRDALPQLQASMQGRLVAAMRAWIGRTDVDVELRLIEDRRPPTLTRSDEVIRAELPFAWLADVWSRGLAVVFGRFCLAANTQDGRTWTLSTVGPDLGPPAEVRIELPAR